ncbi:GyrI-like domain-containing protein [Pseudoneobacillus sp. C159]
MKPKIIEKPVFHVLGYGIETTTLNGQNSSDIPKFWQEYLENNLRNNIPNPISPNVELGICTDFHDGSFTYLIGMEVEPTDQVPEGMIYKTFPASQYAVFTTPNATNETFTQSIQETWGNVFQTWLPTSGYEHSGGAEIEWYDERCWGNEYKQMDIYVPVKKVE